MSDLNQLRELAGQVHPPAFDDLVTTARRRDRRSMAALAGTCAAVLVIAGGGLLLVDGDERSGPVQEPPSTPTPTPTPTPTVKVPRTSMTPEQVVTYPAAELLMTAAALGDTDVRFALWEAACEECPRRVGQQGPTRYKGVALTTDGFRTTRYVTPPFPLRHGLPVRVTSPTDDVFLLADASNGGAWLLHLDGSVTKVRRTETPIDASDPRRSFECYSRRDPRVYQANWCVLDPKTGTSYEMPLSWQEAAVPPGGGRQPWGRDPFDQTGWALQAWWYVGGTRVSKIVSEVDGEGVGEGEAPDKRAETVGNRLDGAPMYWRWSRSSAATLELLTVTDRSADWRVVSRDAPPITWGTNLASTPDGDLLAWTSGPRMNIWRADGADGEFVQVYEADPATPETLWDYTLGVLGDRLQIASYPGSTLLSDDDGRTWTEITTWR